MDVELAADVGAMVLDRAVVDAKLLGYLLARAVFGYHPEYPSLRRSQACKSRAALRKPFGAAAAVDQIGHHRGAYVSLPRRHFPDRVEDVCDGALLEQIPL